VVEMSVVTHIEPEVLTFSTHATLTTSVGTTHSPGSPGRAIKCTTAITGFFTLKASFNHIAWEPFPELISLDSVILWGSSKP